MPCTWRSPARGRAITPTSPSPAPSPKCSRERYVNDGRYSPHRRRRHGRTAAEVPADRFVVAVQNHDQTGNRARGERLSTLLSAEALRLAAALLLLSPYVPLLFMGEEHGETNPFLYFVSHGDPALVEAVRKGRQEEFATFAWAGKIPDPQAEDTFEASRPDWERATSGDGAADAGTVPRAAAPPADRARPAPRRMPPSESATTRPQAGWPCATTRRNRCWKRCSTFRSEPRAVPARPDPNPGVSHSPPMRRSTAGTAEPVSPERELRLPGHTAVLLRRAAA